jgi:shikimate kinase
LWKRACSINVQEKKLNNIILIGMPGCGKSTIGVVLAKVMGFDFIDSDLLMQQRENRLLSQILEEDGPEAFNRIENEVNASIQAEKTVIATGGSVVYGKDAMEHLRNIGVVVYLRLPLEALEERLGDFTERGISMKEGQTLKDIYDERTPHYERYAHIIVDVADLSIRNSVMLIRSRYEEYRSIEVI